MGQVLQAGAGQITARQAAVNAGIPMTVPATTVNKVCLSGLNTIYLADQMIQSGDADIVVAGGMESMTNAPYLLPGARAGYRLGDQTRRRLDDVRRPVLRLRPGGHGRRHREVRGIGRPRPRAAGRARRQSHERAAKAQKDGLFDNEIVTVEVPQRRGDPIVVTEDEGVRGEHHRRVARRAAARVRQGRQHHRRQRLADLRRRRRGDRRLEGQGRGARRSRRSARSSGYGQVAGPDPSLLTQPARAIKQAARQGRPVQIGDIDLFELNEAFAAVGVASMADLGIDDSITNVNGGAIALGHPVGMSGTRVALTLLLELARRGGGLGAAALCGGGGQGDALILKTI